MSTTETNNDVLLERLFSEESAALSAGFFSGSAWLVIENSLAQAEMLRHAQIGLWELLLSMIDKPSEDDTAELVHGLAKQLKGIFETEEFPQKSLELTREFLTDDVQQILVRAFGFAENEQTQIEPQHLWMAVLAEALQLLKQVFEKLPFQVEFEQEEKEAASEAEESPSVDDWTERLSPVMRQALQAEDLTFLALSDRLHPAIERSFAEGEVYEKVTRSLYRSEAMHVVLTGDKGVGKTTVLRELARRAAEGRYPFLADKRFLRLDCSAVPPEDGRAVLERIVREVGDWENLILCLDGMGPLLRRSADSVAFLRAALMRSGLQLVGTLTRWEYQDLLGGDAEFSDLITRIEIDEPSDEEALAILESKREELEREHQVRLDEDVPRRTVALASAYVLSERHPAKALKLLRRACENVNFARTQRGATEARVRAEDVVEVASELTGVPVETLSGDGGTADYEAALTDSVVGQPDAVATVATELKLIKAGLTEPDRPASVLLFAGMTGVGKTELAKALARLYSATGRLQVYSMGNFTEPHTVSGIIGVPPGYVGHDQGGRLVNELNADSYAVFLLDEAEKAHPNVWKPFLNLFDEGWIVDQRGVKAHADRAIFILTTNAGDQQIAQMSQQGKSEEEIISRVKQTLSKIRHERSTQPVFAPQFLARLQRILIFRPLDEAAMIGIARIQVEKMQTTWKRKREKTLMVPDALIEHIGQRGHELNQAAKGQEGGRIIRKLLVDTVECPIQKAVTERTAEYKACSRIEVSFDGSDQNIDGTAGKMNVTVCFE